MHRVSVLALLFAVAALRSACGVTISIPAGNPSALQEYLCNGSLLSNTTLELQRGMHVISLEGFCVVGTELMNVSISGAGKGETTLICGGRWGFGFSRSQNVAIEGLTFVDCGAIEDAINTGVVLHLDSSRFVSLNNVAFNSSYGYSVYGYALADCTVSDVDFAGCFNGSTCYGAYFNGTGNMTLLTIERSTFVGLGIAATDSDNYVHGPRVYAGLEVWGHVADIGDCTFIENRGVALRVCESNIRVSNCSFIGNVADYGPAINAIDILLLNVTFSSFDNNIAIGGGGAILLKAYPNKNVNVVVKFIYCSFQNNFAVVGGALLAYGYDPQSYFELATSTFKNNSACIGSTIYIAGDADNAYGKQSYGVHLIDVVVIENECIRSFPCDKGVSGAAVYFNEISYLNITGYSSTGSQFIGNYQQGAIQGIRGRLHLSGTISFRNNSGESGGAIYLTNDAHLYFHDGCTVDFTGNTATRFGGAIYVEGDESIVTSILTYCAVHFWGNTHNITFQDNHAIVAGHAIYATPIYNCQLDCARGPTFHPANQSDYYQFYTIIMKGSYENQILSFPTNVYLCGCMHGDTHNFPIVSYPGAMIKCNATLMDEANTVSPGVVYAQVVSDQTSATSDLRLAPQQEVQWIGNECTAIQYEIYGPENISTNLQLSTKPGTNMKSISMTLLTCQLGFTLQKDSGLSQCECSTFLTSYGVTCDINHGTVRRNGLQWIGLDLEGNEALANTCPLKYCYSNVHISLARPTDICAGGRIGMLCGQCSIGLSVVFGSAECQKCSNVWLLTILMYAALGALLVAALFGLNLTVTSGTLYGLIFYANILVVNGTIFFSQSSLAPLEIIVSFINLDLGFSLCFYDGMDDLAKTGLQFVFPVYLLVLSLTIVLFSHYCLTWSSASTVSCRHKISRSIGKRSVNVLATLIYLSYSKVLRTVIAIFTYSNIYLANETMIAVWFYDGTIKYLHGKHIVLFVSAMVASVFLVLYTLALMFIPILDVCSEKHKILKWLNQKTTLLKPINDAYYAPYKGNWKIWLGARLWLVVLLYSLGPFLGSQNPRLLLSIHVVLVVIFMVIQACIMPFEEGLRQESGKKNCIKTCIHSICKYIYNFLDLFYLLNYTLLALVVSYLWTYDTVHLNVVVGVLVGTSLFVFFCTIACHTVVILFNQCGGSKTGCPSHGQNETMYPLNERSDNAFTSSTVEVNFGDDKLREPLLDD